MYAKYAWSCWKKTSPHTYIIDPPGEPGSQVARVNPLGRIPALIIDSETCVFDSTVIAEYVDTLNDTPILIPRHNALERMRVRRWEALVDGVMDSAVVVRMESMRPAGLQDASIVSPHHSAITRTLPTPPGSWDALMVRGRRHHAGRSGAGERLNLSGSAPG